MLKRVRTKSLGPEGHAEALLQDLPDRYVNTHVSENCHMLN